MKESRLLALPRELRDLVYEHLLHPSANRTIAANDGRITYHWDLNVYRANRQIHAEAKSVFRRLNTFVKLYTIFPESERYLSQENYVPFISSGKVVDSFQNHHLSIHIESSATFQHAIFRHLLHIDDLEWFSKIWFYSALGNPGINQHLDVIIELHNPYMTEQYGNPVPKALQRRLLEPFGRLKELQSIEFQGQPYPSIEKAVREEMEVPIIPADKCLERAVQLKDEGNAALKALRFHAAIDLYNKAFEAIHIVVVGKRRRDYADRFFGSAPELTSGPYKGRLAYTAWLTIRIILVSNVVFAYLKLEDWKMAHHWGMRSIQLMRDSVGTLEREPYSGLPGVPVSDQIGKIYHRTGVAAKMMGDESEARALLRVAMQYLPNDPSVRREHASVALRI